jgi:endogenous inhibitor of DNA gyrase (YacG/DUF329 family)
MERYKPKPGIYLPTFSNKTTDILFGINLGLYLVDLISGKNKWKCGNTQCNVNIEFPLTQIPFRCTKCGKAVDWDGIYTLRSKMCPECHKPYNKHDNFCANHYSTQVELIEVEHWINPWIGLLQTRSS